MSKFNTLGFNSKSPIPTYPDIDDKERSSPLNSRRMDFLRRENQEILTEEERLKERRKKRRDGSVNDEEKSDSDNDSPRDDYKVEIMRRLMKEFSLDDTIAHYRSLNSVEYAINPNNFSLDSSVHAKQLRKRLRHLLGSEVVKVNDKSFMDHVDTRLREENQMIMARRDVERAERERQRLRRLMSEGVISAKEMRTGEILQDTNKHGKRSSRKSNTDNLLRSHYNTGTRKSRKGYSKKRNKSAKPVRMESSSFKHMDTEYNQQAEALSMAYRAHSMIENFLYNTPSTDVESQMSRMSSTREEASTDSSMGDLCLPLNTKPHKSSATRTRSSTPCRHYMNSCATKSGTDGCSRQTPTTCTPRSVFTERRFRHPALEELRTEQSVDGLYNIAEQILPRDRTRPYFEQKKTTR